MAYEKHQWQNGEIINATKLNHIEDGVASCSSNTINITWHEDTLTYSSNITSFDELQAIINSPNPIYLTFTDMYYDEEDGLDWNTLRPMLVTQAYTGETIVDGSIPHIYFSFWTMSVALHSRTEGNLTSTWFYLDGVNVSFLFLKSDHSFVEVDVSGDVPKTWDTLNLGN